MVFWEPFFGVSSVGNTESWCGGWQKTQSGVICPASCALAASVGLPFLTTGLLVMRGAFGGFVPDCTNTKPLNDHPEQSRRVGVMITFPTLLKLRGSRLDAAS